VGRLGLGLGSGSHVVGQLGAGMRVSASFQIIPCPMSRLGLELGRRLGSGPRFVARLGSRVCRLADGGGGRGICPTPCKKRGNCPGGNVSEGNAQGKMSYTPGIMPFSPGDSIF